MIESSQPIMTLQFGIIEEVSSDEDESPEIIATRAFMGKWTRTEATTMEIFQLESPKQPRLLQKIGTQKVIRL